MIGFYSALASMFSGLFGCALGAFFLTCLSDGFTARDRWTWGSVCLLSGALIGLMFAMMVEAV